MYECLFSMYIDQNKMRLCCTIAATYKWEYLHVYIDLNKEETTPADCSNIQMGILPYIHTP